MFAPTPRTIFFATIPSLLGCFLFLSLAFGIACTKQQGKVAETAAVRIGTDVCKEVSGQAPDPALVALLCDAAGNEVSVLLPKDAWRAAKAAKADAGPGL